MDSHLEEILIDDSLGWFTMHHPRVLTAAGTTAERLQTLGNVLA
jgi:hypothetical protein